jgi:hypothetical protein
VISQGVDVASIDFRQYYRRSPFQVGLLSFCTLGVYVFWWVYYTRRTYAALVEETESPVWMSLALLVPFLNLFAFYDTFQKVKTLAERARVPVSPWLIVACLAWLACAILGRFPAPIGVLEFFSFLFIAYAQTYVTRAEFVLSGYHAHPVRFSWIEIVVVALGGVFKALIFIGLLADPEAKVFRLSPYWPFITCTEAAVLALLAHTYFKSRTILEWAEPIAP